MTKIMSCKSDNWPRGLVISQNPPENPIPGMMWKPNFSGDLIYIFNGTTWILGEKFTLTAESVLYNFFEEIDKLSIQECLKILDQIDLIRIKVEKKIVRTI